MRGWRNWQTRTFEGRVGNRTGSSPVLRTNAALSALSRKEFLAAFLFLKIIICGILAAALAIDKFGDTN